MLNTQESEETFNFSFAEAEGSVPSISFVSNASSTSSSPTKLLNTKPEQPKFQSTPTKRSLKRQNLLSPHKLKLKKRINFLSKSKLQQKQNYDKKIRKLKSVIHEQETNQVKHLKHEINRKRNIICEKNLKIRNLRKKILSNTSGTSSFEQLKKVRNELRLLKRKYKRLQSKMEERKTVVLQPHDDKTSRLKAAINFKDATINKLEKENSLLLESVENSSISSSFKKEKHYPSNIRLFIYDAILMNVPTANIAPLIKSFANRTKLLDLAKDIPHRTSIENMAREIGIIAAFQAAEFIIKNSNLTLGFDATTQNGIHVNSILVTSKETCLIVALDELPGGTSEDYENHITESIDFIAKIYSSFEEIDFQNCRNLLINGIANTMTDRATVNHATIRRLELAWNKSLNELNCHLHPLETIASCCKTALKKTEDEEKQKYPQNCPFQFNGSEAAAPNLIWIINKIRYKDSSGDPKGFGNALRKAGLPQGLLPRYRGNRLHILFHISGLLLHHYNFFNNFFAHGSIKCDGTFLKRLTHDFNLNITKVELQVFYNVEDLLEDFYILSLEHCEH